MGALRDYRNKIMRNPVEYNCSSSRILTRISFRTNRTASNEEIHGDGLATVRQKSSDCNDDGDLYEHDEWGSDDGYDENNTDDSDGEDD